MDASAADLANYREQVAAIDQALKDDPSNAELLSVKTELLELISLTEAILQQQPPPQPSSSSAVDGNAAVKNHSVSPHVSVSPLSASASPMSPAHAASTTIGITSSPSTTSSISTTASTTTASAATAAAAAAASRPVFEEFLPHHKRQQQAQDRVWAVGDKCRALYEGDGKFYEATILAVGQSGDLFTVEFKGYESSPPSLVRKQDLRPSHDHSHKKRKQISSEEVATGDEAEGASSTAATTAAAGKVAPKKKKVNKAAEEAQEQIQKQNAWKNFATKGKKTGILAKKSMFATPDSPHGKVGVVGSGKGMTQFQQRGKHIYNVDE
ncbi:hypothetical protein BGW41_003102 [Actinomortierella wolfii]|nr:hypothetical protein BGW41_003102 [Actinomortierella wolfii]